MIWRWRTVVSREALLGVRGRLRRPAIVDRQVKALKAQAKRWLPERFHAITDEVAKFGIIGVLNLLVNFAVFNLLWLTVLRTGEVKAKAVATIVATTCAYFMNRHWTYRDRPKSTLRREYSLFFFFNLVGLVIEVTVVAVAKYGFHLTHIVVLNICTLLGIALGTIFRFWAYRTHVFKAGTEGADDGRPALLVTDLETETDLETDLGTELETQVDEHAALQDELTQLELEGIVQQAEQPARN